MKFRILRFKKLKNKIEFLSPKIIECKAKSPEPEDVLENVLKKFGFSSVFNLKTLIFPSKSFEISSTTGATILHGPHHGAQKSTNTGRSLCSTSLSNEESVTAGADDKI